VSKIPSLRLLSHPKGFRSLVAIVVVCTVLGATLLVPGTTATTVNIAISSSVNGASNDFNFLTTFPVTVGFSVTSKSPGSTYVWQFGDGSSSTEVAPIHIFNTPCVYPVTVQVTSSNGSLTSGGVVMGAFAQKGSPGALAVCPPQGTAGIAQVELAGGFFRANQIVDVMMGGSSLTTVTADKGGDWVLNVSGFLTPQPSGYQYNFTTSPPSLARVFTTVSGVRASPASGAPGDSVFVEGRSYPAYSSVQVSLGGASLGTAQTDGSGSFSTGFQVPSESPLTTAGTYQYTTDPPILGSQASFTSAGGGGGTTIPETVFAWWWLLLIVIIIVLVILLAYLLWRGRRRRAIPQAQGEG
jgi:PKD repeat protein